MTQVSKTIDGSVKSVAMIGTLKFWNEPKKFGIVITSSGDVFIHETNTFGMLEDMRKKDAVISIDVLTEYKDDIFKRSAMAVTKVTLPEIRTVWAAVKVFNRDRCSAVVFLGEIDLLDHTAFIPKSVIQKSTIMPGVGMPMRAVIKKTSQGWDVLSYESNEKIAVAYKIYMAEMLAQIEAQKHVETSEPVVATTAEEQLFEPVVVEAADKQPSKKTRLKRAHPQEQKTLVNGGTIPVGELPAVVTHCIKGEETALAAAMLAAIQPKVFLPETIH